jgi:hypothetical protein
MGKMGKMKKSPKTLNILRKVSIFATTLIPIPPCKNK